jgi:hypothetical protein
MEQNIMIDTKQPQSLDFRLRAAAKAIRFAGIGVLPSDGNTQAALDAVIEARQADPSFTPVSDVAEVTLRTLTRAVLPSAKFCKEAARQVEAIVEAMAQRAVDAPAVDRPRG